MKSDLSHAVDAELIFDFPFGSVVEGSFCFLFYEHLLIYHVAEMLKQNVYIANVNDKMKRANNCFYS